MKNNYRIEGDLVYIQIYCHGQLLETVIDRDDLDKVSDYDCTWYGHVDSKSGNIYVKSNKHSRLLLLHRIISGATGNMVAHHKDLNTLNNTSINVEVCTRAENNKVKNKYKNGSSGIRGVAKIKSHWRVTVPINGKNVYLGEYKDMYEAGRVATYHRIKLGLPVDRNPIQLKRFST